MPSHSSRTALACAAAIAACGAPRAPAPLAPAAEDSASAAALDAVLLRRERARHVVVWRARLGEGPPLTERAAVVRADQAARGVAPLPTPAAGRPVAAADLQLGVPVTVVGEPELAALFAQAPDGWRAFFRRYPGASGVAELSRALPVAPGRAIVYVARQCGEQCASVFRVEVARGAGGRWVGERVEVVGRSDE